MNDDVKLMGAAIRGVLDALLNHDAVLAEFPRKDELATVDDREFEPTLACCAAPVFDHRGIPAAAIGPWPPPVASGGRLYSNEFGTMSFGSGPP